MVAQPSPTYFTPAEANAALGDIRPWVAEILEIRQRILDKNPQVWPILERAAGNGGSQAASQLAFEFVQLDSLVHKIKATGAILKDVNSGLVDFLSWREGRVVYLCWKFDEPAVAFWHELEAGFAGRQLI